MGRSDDVNSPGRHARSGKTFGGRAGGVSRRREGWHAPPGATHSGDLRRRLAPAILVRPGTLEGPGEGGCGRMTIVPVAVTEAAVPWPARWGRRATTAADAVRL